MENFFNDKVAIVSGGARGIGASVVKLFLKSGMYVVSSYENETNEVIELKEKLSNFADRVVWHREDISLPATSSNLCNISLEKWGRIDCVVANAGISYLKPFARISDEDLHRIINVNQLGVYYLLKEAGKVMKKAGSGSVVTMSSVFTKRVQKMNSIYAATKSFVETLTKGFALEYAGYGIKANCLSCGVTETEMNRVALSTSREAILNSNISKKVAQPEEIADIVKFLISPESSFINGQVVQADGGYLNGL